MAAGWQDLLCCGRSTIGMEPEQPPCPPPACRFVHWIDIGLVANDTFVPLLFQVLNAPQESLRGAAADVLTEIVRWGASGCFSTCPTGSGCALHHRTAAAAAAAAHMWGRFSTAELVHAC